MGLVVFLGSVIHTLPSHFGLQNAANEVVEYTLESIAQEVRRGMAALVESGLADAEPLCKCRAGLLKAWLPG